jgi:hypothetical protein
MGLLMKYLQAKKYKTGQYAVVEWIDACSSDEWEEANEISLSPQLIVTLGIIFEITRDKIVLAMNYDRENDSYSCMMAIPSGMILSIKIMK